MKIGKSVLEDEAEKILECRQIVKNLVNFGVTEKQKIHIIYLLSLELESRDNMKKIIDTIKNINNESEDQKFILTNQNDEYNDNKPKKIIEN